MKLTEYVDVIEAALDDCKLALEEHGLKLDKRPCLSDLPALIRAVKSGEIPETYGVGTDRSIKEHVDTIEEVLPKIETALSDCGVTAENLRISEIADKIREIILYIQCPSYILTHEEAHQVYTDVKAPEDARIYKLVGGTVAEWVDEETDTCYVSTQHPKHFLVLPRDLSATFQTAWMGKDNETLVSIEFGDIVDFSKTEILTHTFYRCTALESMDLSGHDFSNVTSMIGMFEGCTNLKSVNLSGLQLLNAWNIEEIFLNCENLEEVNMTDFYLPDFNTLSGLVSMFENCKSLKKLDLSSLTVSCTSISMFKGCENLTELDLSGFEYFHCASDTFKGCKNLSTIYAQEWYSDQEPNAAIFEDCVSLPGYSPDAANDITFAKWKENGGYLTNPAEKPKETS